MIAQIDIWNNISECYDTDNIWYKQTFIEDEPICYEDYLGNYWAKEFGELPYPKIIFKNSLLKTKDLKLSLDINTNTLFLSYHSTNAEAELTALLNEQVTNEIDMEIMRTMMSIDPYQVEDEIGVVNLQLTETIVNHEIRNIDNEYRRVDIDGNQI